MPADPKPEDWSILGVTWPCTRAEVRAAFVARATALHPDRHPDLDDATRARLDRAMATLNAAWDRVEAWPGWNDLDHDDDAFVEEHDRASRDVDLEPPPGFHAMGAGSHRYQLRLVGQSRDLLRLADWADRRVAYRRLRCNDRRIDADHLAVAVAALPELRSLDLDGTGVDDAAVAHLRRATRLTDLHLCETNVTDDAVRVIAGLQHLHALSLADTRVTDAGLVHLDGHRNLAVLNIRGTGVRGPGLAALAGCPRLRLVALSRVRKEHRRALAELRPDLAFA